MSSTYITNKISETVYGIVEDDRFYENPIMYVVFGTDRAALIDSGCATGDLLHYLRHDFLEHCTEQQAELVRNRVILVNTHNHYDHVASNFRFSDPKTGLADGIVDLCASSADRAYTRDLFSTLSWYSGCSVKPYTVTRWLDDGEKIFLSDKENTESSLEVIHSPGHTPDSMCLFYPRDRRLFVGDVIYRWAFVMAVGVQACPRSFETSTDRLVNFIQTKERELGQPIKLSCGHNDNDLESSYMKRLADLFRRINNKTISSSSSWCSLYAEYAEPDGELSVAIRKLRYLDRILKPILKLCCCRRY